MSFTKGVWNKLWGTSWFYSLLC